MNRNLIIGSIAIAAAIAIYLKMVQPPEEPPIVVPPVVPPVRPPVVPPVVPPIRPPVVPPVVPPVRPYPGDIRPLPNPDHERIRQSYARDLGKRGGKWLAAEREFLLATNPGMPASFSVQTIYDKYQQIFNRMVGRPVILPITPPVVPPVVPPGAPVPVAWALYKRLFPDHAAKIERVYREAGYPVPLSVMVHADTLRQAMDRAGVRVIA